MCVLRAPTKSCTVLSNILRMSEKRWAASGIVKLSAHGAHIITTNDLMWDDVQVHKVLCTLKLALIVKLTK